MQSPVHKLKLIFKCIALIIECIKRFYSSNGVKLNSEIESDDLLSIIIYIIVKS